MYSWYTVVTETQTCRTGVSTSTKPKDSTVLRISEMIYWNIKKSAYNSNLLFSVLEISIRSTSILWGINKNKMIQQRLNQITCTKKINDCLVRVIIMNSLYSWLSKIYLGSLPKYVSNFRICYHVYIPGEKIRDVDIRYTGVPPRRQ